MRRFGLLALLFTIAGCDVFLDDFAVKYLIGQLDARGNHVVDVVFSPDGTKLASTDTYGSISLWDLEGRETIKEIVLSDPEPSMMENIWPIIAFMSDLLVVQYFGPDDNAVFDPPKVGVIKFYSANDGLPVEVGGLPTEVSFDNMTVLDGELVVGERGSLSSSSYSLAFYQISAGQLSRIREWPVDGEVTELAAASDGSRLAACIRDRQEVDPQDDLLKVWKASDGTELFSRRYSVDQVGQEMRMLALSADGSRVAYCPYPQGRVVVWEIDEEIKDMVSEGGTEGESCFLTYSPDGRWLAVNTQGTHLYPGNDMKPAVSISNGHFFTGSVAFSPDSRTMAVGYADKIRLWDVTDIKQ